MKLLRRPKVGYYIEDKVAGYQLLVSQNNDDADRGYYYTPQERVAKITGLIFSSGDPIIIQDIMDKLYISRSTVIRDLAVVRKWFSSRGIQLRQKPNQGIHLQVSEEKWRELATDWIRENVEENSLSQNLLGLLISKNFEASRAHEVLKYLDMIITIANFTIIRSGIAKVCDILGIQLSDSAFVSLLIHIALAINRLLHQKQITMNEKQLAELQLHKAYKVIDQIFNPIFAQHDVPLPLSEVGYILIHFLSAQKLWEQDSYERNGQVDEIIEIVLRHVYKFYQINLRKNSNLLRGLKLHLQPAIFRSKYDIPTVNPLLDRVKSDYFQTYQLCCKAMTEINQKYNIDFDENEIGFITLHIEAALKNYQGSLSYPYSNIVLICATGLGSAKILSANIRSKFANLRIVAELSVMDVASYDYTNVHFAVTTITLPIPLPIPVIKVNAVPDKRDMLHIRSFLRNQAAGVPDIQQLIQVIEGTCDVRDKAILHEQLKVFLVQRFRTTVPQYFLKY